MAAEITVRLASMNDGSVSVTVQNGDRQSHHNVPADAVRATRQALERAPRGEVHLPSEINGVPVRVEVVGTP